MTQNPEDPEPDVPPESAEPKAAEPEAEESEAAEPEAEESEAEEPEAAEPEAGESEAGEAEAEEAEAGEPESEPEPAEPIKLTKATEEAATEEAAPAEAAPAEAAPAEAAPAGASSGGAPSTGRRTAALILAVVALLSAGWFGWSWYGAAHDESLQYSETREEVLRAGEQTVLNLNTLDHRNLNQGLKLWQDSSTNELYQQIVRGRTGFEREVRTAKTITSAKVLDAAVTELDEHAGKAAVIVGIQITVTPPKGAPVVKKTRLMGELTRTATGWKLSGLAQAPVGATG